jgi:hypothetical protein
MTVDFADIIKSHTRKPNAKRHEHSLTQDSSPRDHRRYVHASIHSGFGRIDLLGHVEGPTRLDL